MKPPRRSHWSAERLKPGLKLRKKPKKTNDVLGYGLLNLSGPPDSSISRSYCSSRHFGPTELGPPKRVRRNSASLGRVNRAPSPPLHWKALSRSDQSSVRRSLLSCSRS